MSDKWAHSQSHYILSLILLMCSSLVTAVSKKVIHIPVSGFQATVQASKEGNTKVYLTFINLKVYEIH